MARKVDNNKKRATRKFIILHIFFEIDNVPDTEPFNRLGARNFSDFCCWFNRNRKQFEKQYRTYLSTKTNTKQTKQETGKQEE